MKKFIVTSLILSVFFFLIYLSSESPRKFINKRSSDRSIQLPKFEKLRACSKDQFFCNLSGKNYGKCVEKFKICDHQIRCSNEDQLKCPLCNHNFVYCDLSMNENKCMELKSICFDKQKSNCSVNQTNIDNICNQYKLSLTSISNSSIELLINSTYSREKNSSIENVSFTNDSIFLLPSTLNKSTSLDDNLLNLTNTNLSNADNNQITQPAPKDSKAANDLQSTTTIVLHPSTTSELFELHDLDNVTEYTTNSPTIPTTNSQYVDAQIEFDHSKHTINKNYNRSQTSDANRSNSAFKQTDPISNDSNGFKYTENYKDYLAYTLYNQNDMQTNKNASYESYYANYVKGNKNNYSSYMNQNDMQTNKNASYESYYANYVKGNKNNNYSNYQRQIIEQSSSKIKNPNKATQSARYYSKYIPEYASDGQGSNFLRFLKQDAHHQSISNLPSTNDKSKSLTESDVNNNLESEQSTSYKNFHHIESQNQKPKFNKHPSVNVSKIIPNLMSNSYNYTHYGSGVFFINFGTIINGNKNINGDGNDVGNGNGNGNNNGNMKSDNMKDYDSSKIKNSSYFSHPENSAHISSV